MIIYKVEEYLKAHNLGWKDTGVEGNTRYKLMDNECITTNTLNKICNNLHCELADIIEYIPDPGYEKEISEVDLLKEQMALLQKEISELKANQ